MNISKSSVFGSWKVDVLVFVVPLFLATLFSETMRLIGPSSPPMWYFPLLVITFDTPHLICGFWVMMRQEDVPPLLRLKVVGLLVFAVALFCYFWGTGNEAMAITFLALMSLWHFIRQHQAWFYLAMSKGTPVGAWTLRINRIGIAAATWGFFLAGQCSGDRYGWNQINDIALLPVEWRTPLLVCTFLGLALYVMHHALLILKTRVFEASGHLIFLTAIFVWGITRLFDDAYFTTAVIIIPHAAAYFYLLMRLTKSSKRSLGPADPLWLLLGVYGLAVLLQLYGFWPFLIGDPKELTWFGNAVIMGLTVAHFLHDKLFWNTKSNPGWKKNI